MLVHNLMFLICAYKYNEIFIKKVEDSILMIEMCLNGAEYIVMIQRGGIGILNKMWPHSKRDRVSYANQNRIICGK